MKSKKHLLVFILIIFIFSNIKAGENWQIIIGDKISNDEAIKVAVNELKLEGAIHGINFSINNEKSIEEKNTILVGDIERNSIVKKLANTGKIKLNNLSDSQSFQIITSKHNNSKLIVVSAGSILGEVYGVFWILDRLKVNKFIPEINCVREPELKIRFSSGRSKELMRRALRYGATWVWGSYSVNDLIPWNSEPEKSVNEKNRKELRELIDYAHSLHLKYIVYEDEFSYHPSLQEEFGFKLNPEDPSFWKAVKAKYRRLLQAMPEIDGVRHRTGEATRVGGSYKSFDVMHSGDSYWSLAKRYRSWIKNIYDVVVGEFDKIYYQRTWVTSSHEQHSMSAVYKEIFNNEIPVKNLYMSPYMSTTDRYFHQPYNPTFNTTPHNMIVLLSPLNYHGNNNCGILPTFPASYYQGGLKTYLSVENPNCKGADFGILPNDKWDSWTLTSYSAYRLTWEPNINVKEIAHDFSAMHFGIEAANDLAELLMLTPRIYKYGMYIAPAAHGQFASLTHLRLTTFPAKGLPNLDNGRKHMEFLKKIYLRCRPWIEETILYLDHGLDLAAKAKDVALSSCENIIKKEKRELIINNSKMTYSLVEVNNYYVKAMINYFEYWETHSLINKVKLEESTHKLEIAISKFQNVPGFTYRLDGIEQLIINIKSALDDIDKATELITKSPNDIEIDELIDDQQEKYKSVLDKYKGEAKKILYWQGRVDGRDLFKLKGNSIEIEHLRYDEILETSEKFTNELPSKNYTVIPVDIQSRSFGPFVLEQPSEENNYTVTLYLSDSPKHGYSWWKFELYYIPKSPKELGLQEPWRK